MISRKKAAALLMSMCLLMGSASALPGRNKKVHAAQTDVAGFATKEQLLSDFSMDGAGNKKIKKVWFGQNGKGSPQSWYIAGKDPASVDGLVLFAATSLKKQQAFDTFQWDKKYCEDWGCVYKNKPKEVFANHYGGSELRSVLRNMAGDLAYFSEAEQNLMRKTAIKTEDRRNRAVYTTEDKLYAAYGEYGGTVITVGTNEEKDLNSGLQIDLTKYITESSLYFWLRSPSSDGSGEHYAMRTRPSGQVIDYIVANEHRVLPAFQLDMSSVIFASDAPAALSNGSHGIGEKEFTLRYDAGDTLGSAAIYNHRVAEVKGTAADRYLVVQNDRGIWMKKVDTATTILADEVAIDGMQLSSFEGCKVWLEKTDTDRITRATLADEKEKVIVVFKDGDGKDLDKQEVAYGEAAKEPEAPCKEGYTFIGWDKAFDKITGDVIITARYRKDPEPVKPTETVKDPEPVQPTESVKRPVINIRKKRILSGEKLRLNIKNLVKGAVVSYKTSNRKIASVDKNGVIKGIRDGKATITTTIREGRKTYTLKNGITVKGYIKFSKAKKMIKKGKSYKFKAKAYGISERFVWSVSKKKIGKISKIGKFKAKKRGKVYVIVKCGKYKEKICVKVK